MDRIGKLLLILTLAGGVAGCFHEALATGPTQCLAPHEAKTTLASATVAGPAPLSARAAVTASN